MKDKIFSSFFIILSFTFLGKIFGFVEKQIIAYYFGTGWEVDAYFLAVNLSLAIYIFFEEILQPTFLPFFLKSKEISHQKAYQFANSLFIFLGIILLLISVACVQWSVSIIKIFAPGFEGEKLALSTNLFQIMSLVIVFQGISTLLYYFLNSYKFFFIPALGQFAFKMMSALGIIIFYSSFGIRSLALAFLTAVIFKFVIIVSGVIAKKLYYFTRIYLRNVGMKQFLFLILPLVIGIFFHQLSDRVDDYFASQLSEGMLASINYAKKVVWLPLMVIPNSLVIVLLPFFSSFASDPGNQENLKNLRILFIKWFQIVFFIFILLEIYFLIMDQFIIQFIFERGKFDTLSTHLTAQVFFYYSLGLAAVAIDYLIVQLFYSFRDTRTPIIVGISCILLNILLTVLLINSLQHRAIGLAFSVYKIIKVIILFSLIQNKVLIFERKGFISGVISLIFIIGPALVILLISRFAVNNFFGQEQLFYQNFLTLFITSFVFFGGAFIIAYKKKLFYMDQILEMVKGLITHRKSITDSGIPKNNKA